MFRKLIFLDVLILLLASISALIDLNYYQQLYPETLQTYLEIFDDLPITTIDHMFGFTSVIFVIWAVQNLVALYRFKAYAPKHLLILTLIAFVMSLVKPLAPIVSISLWMTLWDLSTFLSGFMLALVFFSNISKEFKN